VARSVRRLAGGERISANLVPHDHFVHGGSIALGSDESFVVGREVGVVRSARTSWMDQVERLTALGALNHSMR
jgi:hypothetical protein